MKTLSRTILSTEGPPAPAGNGAAQEAALLEAVWRADELAAALEAAQRELAAVRGQLARAEESIAELTEIGDAAQAAIDRLRAKVTKREAEARLSASDRGALAAELHRHVRRAAIDLDALGGELFRALREREARAQPSRRGIWQQASARLHYFRRFISRRARAAIRQSGS